MMASLRAFGTIETNKASVIKVYEKRKLRNLEKELKDASFDWSKLIGIWQKKVYIDNYINKTYYKILKYKLI